MKTRTRLPFALLLAGFLSYLPNSNAAAAYSLQTVATGMVSPLVLVSLPDSPAKLLVADQVGKVYLIDNGKLRDQLVLDLTPKLKKLNEGFDERGLLSVAFHPKYNANRKVYLSYSAPLRSGGPEGWDHTSHISEFKVGTDNTIDIGSEKVLLQIDQPQFNHNGGRLAFGPDGFLYIGVGDGGNANDSGLGHNPKTGNGQDLTTLLGKILRIDVDSGTPYGVPKDNPFAGKEGARDEIYAYGLRNPWGISFDRGGSHQLFAADVGQDLYEEVNIITKGGNYGWYIREGFHCFDPKSPAKSPEDCPKVGADGKPLLDPILEYKNFKKFSKDPEGRGTSVTGGYVYRGKALPELNGHYIFADWSRAWALPQGVLFDAAPPAASGGKWKLGELPLAPGTQVNGYVVALGEDAQGELYILVNGRNSLTGTTGKVLKLVAGK